MSKLDKDSKISKICEKIANGNPSLEEIKNDLLTLKNKGRKEWPLSPLVYAIHAKREDLFLLMIQDFGFNVDSINKGDDQSWCALAAAVQDGNEEMVKRLVSRFDLNILLILK
jgi:hypothetical protein